jgi:NADPH:quinone reductase-like Zn-dependent oxidoreductase
LNAIVYETYGPPEVLRLQEVPTPEPKENEVRVRVTAAAVNYGDLTARNFKNIPASEFNMPLPLLLPARLSFGWSQPKVNILGSEFAGTVEAAGPAVKRFKAGDPVFGYLGQRMGAYAEYLCMPEDGLLARAPEGMGVVEAATVPYGAIMAASLLSQADIQPGQKVLINGASGSIGAAALQLAKAYGAEVTGVCGSGRVAYVQALGAEHVIDYTREDFTQNGEVYDLVFDVLGRSAFGRVKNSLTPEGIYLLASFKMKAVLQMVWTKIGGGRQVICALANEKTESLELIRELAAAGQYRAVVDKTFPLEQAAAAHRYVESGSKKGPVALTMPAAGLDAQAN